MSDLLGVLLKATRRWERATAAVVSPPGLFGEADRNRLHRDIVEANRDIATTEFRRRAERMVRALDRRTMALIGSVVGGAFILGTLIGGISVGAVFWRTGAGPWSTDAAWSELARYNPDPRNALSRAETKTTPDGRHYAVVSFWTDPPVAAPASHP